MTDFNVFLSSIRFLQNLHNSTPFNFYEKCYHKLFQKLFRLSSVSISFRICFKKEILNKLNERDKLEIKEKVLSFVNENKNYKKKSQNITNNSILDIDTLLPFLNANFSNYSTLNNKRIEDLFSIELLLVKRAVSNNDKYSGNVAFPGGKYEKEDKSDFRTAVRETSEEIGLDLCEDHPIISRYLGHNTRFDVTLDFRYLVTSHLFLIFDMFRESENYFKISEKELSNIFFVSLDYLINIDHNNQKEFDKSVIQQILGEETFINKLILNKNENFLVYGLTLRKILHLLNIAGDSNLKYVENFNIKGRLRKIGFLTIYNLLKFLTNPLNSYNLIKVIIMIVFSYYSINYFNEHFIRSKF